MNMPLNLALYLVGVGAMLVPFLPFSPMTIDLVNLSRERQLAVYRKRHWFWAASALSFIALILAAWVGRDTPDAATWWWVIGISLAILSMLYWSGYVPVV